MAQPKVLLVDDNEISLTIARAALEAAGLRVVTLDTPLGFNAAVLAERPDLALVDVSMPALSGDRLVSIARRHDARARGLGVERLPKCLLVLYSHMGGEELAALAQRCGADGFLPKSVPPGDLASRVLSFLSTAEAAPRAAEPHEAHR